MTFDETAHFPRDVLKYAGDKEIEEIIFIDDGLQDVDGDKDELLLPSISSSEHIHTFTLEAEAPHVTTSFTLTMEALRVEAEIISESGAPSHIQ
jgi:hypothetical protein